MSRRPFLVLVLAAAIAVTGAAIAIFASRGDPPSPRPGLIVESESAASPPPPRVLSPGLAPAPHAARAAAPNDSAPNVATGGTLVVRVTVEGEKREAIAGAQVRAYIGGSGDPLRTETDAVGTARLERVPAGTVDVRADLEGFAGNERKNVEVAVGSKSVVEIALARGTAFDGTVVNALDGKPVPGAAIEVTAGGSVGGFTSESLRAPFDRMLADAEGRFRVRGVPEGEIATVRASAEGFRLGMLGVRILGGAVTPAPVVVRIEPGAIVRGTVRDPSGRTVPGARVYVMPESSEQLRRNPSVPLSSRDAHVEAAHAAADERGAYVISGLALGDVYVAVAEADGFARSAEVVGLRLDRDRLETTADLIVRVPARLVVRLVDLDEKPVTQPAAVWVGDDGIHKDTPDVGNEYRFQGLNAGEHKIDVLSPSHLRASATVRVEAGAAAETVVRLDPGARIEGTVVYEDEKPVAGASVYAGPAAANMSLSAQPLGVGIVLSEQRETRTDEQGRFSLRGLVPGEMLVGAETIPPPPLTGPSMTVRASRAIDRTLEFVRVHAPTTGTRLVLVRLGTVALRLVTPEGSPYTGATTVEFGSESVSRGGLGWRTENGRVRIEALIPGTYAIQVDCAGWSPVKRTVIVRVNEDTDLGDVVLERGLELVGSVVDRHGKPVLGARVHSAIFDGAIATDGDGRFVIPHLVTGTASFSVDADGFLSVYRDAEVSPGHSNVEVTLSHGALLRAVVRDADGTPAVNIPLAAVPLGADGKPDPDRNRDWESPKGDGRAEWRIPAGRWRVAWGVGGEEVPLGEWTLAEDETRDVALSLPRR